MEPSNVQTQQPTAIPQTPQPIVNQTPQSTVITDEKSSGGSKKLLIIFLVILLIALAGAGYWFMTQGTNTQPTPETQSQTQNPANVLGALKEELEAVNVEEANAQEDLTQLDQDLSQL